MVKRGVAFIKAGSAVGFDGEFLVLPEAAESFFRVRRMTNAFAVLSCLRAFPSEVARVMGWSMAEIRNFTAQIIKCMRGVLPSEQLIKRKPMKVSFGAMPPPGVAWMMGRTVQDIDAINSEAKSTGRSSSEVAESPYWKKS